MSKAIEFEHTVDAILGTKPTTYVAIILDQSGSMGGISNEIIGGFNDQLQMLKEKEKTSNIYVSLIKFGTYVNVLFRNKKPSEINKLTKDDYAPCGMTALCDAVGMGIKTLEKYDQEGDISFLFLIMSDGYENASSKYTKSDIKEMVETLNIKDNWTFTYLGANQDLWSVANDLGFDMNAMAKFTATNDGTIQAYCMNTTAVNDYFVSRENGLRSVKNFYNPKTSC